MVKYIWLIIHVLLSSIGMVFIKKGSQATEIIFAGHKLAISFDIYLLLGLIGYLSSFLIWLVVISKFDLTYISPLSYGLLFIAISTLSYFILGETMNIKQILGVILIISGVVVVIASGK